MRSVVVSSLVLVLVGFAPGSARPDGPPDLSWLGGGHIGISALAVAPDGAAVLTAGSGDHTLKLWSLDDADLVRTLTAHYGMVNAVAIAPAGDLAASVGEAVFGLPDDGLKLWSLPGGDVVQALPTGFQEGWSVAFSPDGALLAAGVGYEVWIYRVADAALLHKLRGHKWSVFGLAFSPDGTVLASASGDHAVKLWSVPDFALLRTLSGHTFFVSAVAFHPAGEVLASSSWDGTVRLWRVADGAPLGTLTGHADAVNDVAFSPDGTRLASAGADHAILVRSYPGGDVIHTLDAPYASTVAFTPDGGRVVGGGYDGKARTWAAASGQLLLTFGHHAAAVHDVAFAPAGDVLATIAQDMTGRLWEPATGSERAVLLGHTDVINDLDVTDVLVATGAGSPPPNTVDPTIKLWRASDGALLHTLPGHFGGTRAVSFAPGGAVLVSAGWDEQLKFWRPDDGSLTHAAPAGAVLRELVHSPDGTLLAGATFDLAVRLYDAASGAFLRAIPLASAASAIAFSPDGTLLLAGLDAYGDNVAIHRVADGALVRTFAGHADGFVHDVAWSPDGGLVASTSGYTFEIKFWRPDDGSLLATYDRETGWGPWPELPLAFSPDGATFAYGRADATVGLARNPFGLTPVGADPAPLAAFAHPNPFTTATVIAARGTAAGPLALRIADVRGRVVRRLATNAWDGRDDAGRPLPAGVYLVETRDAHGVVARGKVVLARGH